MVYKNKTSSFNSKLIRLVYHTSRRPARIRKVKENSVSVRCQIPVAYRCMFHMKYIYLEEYGQRKVEIDTKIKKKS
jgi:hypothetical protein